MCSELRIPLNEVPDAFQDQMQCFKRPTHYSIHAKAQRAPLLIEHNGHYELVNWGNQNNPQLPRTGYCKEESILGGKWRYHRPRKVRIIASAGWTRGVWYQIRSGLEGILIEKNGEKFCFLMTKPATHYFKIMTGAERMPVLIDQEI